MQVEMLVGVDMVERQAGGGIGGKLRLDLGGELGPCGGLCEDVETQPCHVGAKMA
jgi:hypothetical protein